MLFRYVFLRFTASYPFHRVRSAVFFTNSSSSSGVHSCLSYFYVRILSRAIIPPETLSSLRIRRGRAVLHYLVKIDRDSMSYQETYLLKEMKCSLRLLLPCGWRFWLYFRLSLQCLFWLIILYFWWIEILIDIFW